MNKNNIEVQSKTFFLSFHSLSEFYSLVKDIEETLTDVLDYEEDMAAMYLTHAVLTG